MKHTPRVQLRAQHANIHSTHRDKRDIPHLDLIKFDLL